MSKYGGSIVGKSAMWNVTTGYHSSYYGGPQIAGVPDRMDVEDDVPTTAEAAAAAGRKKNTTLDGGYGDDD